MPRFAANLTMLFGEVPFLERFEKAAAVGFEAVEYLFPYDSDPDDLAARLKRHGLQQVLFNLPPGKWDQGERGIAALPGREEEFRSSVDTALRYAESLQCPRIHCMSGVVPGDKNPDQCRKTYVENLKFLAEKAGAAGRTVLIEALNVRDVPGYLISLQEESAEIASEVGLPNVKIQFDIYHCQIMQGDLLVRLEKLMPMIGHIQIADVPGRHEPGTGEINFANLLPKLDVLGYEGWVGCEYVPQNRTEEGLSWITPFRR